MRTTPLLLLLIAIIGFSCDVKKENKPSGSVRFELDKTFLIQHDPAVIELTDEKGQARILLSPKYQGRVMTSTAGGEQGQSYGWINYPLISYGDWVNQFNPVGGEERFWVGPEGGQFSFYFSKGDSFNISHWQVPALIDTIAFEVQSSTSNSVTFHKSASLINYSGATFNIGVNRSVALLDARQLEEALAMSLPASVNFVGYESNNEITNEGPNDWKKETGLMSVWLLGMMTPSDSTTVIIPFKGPKTSITSNYFGDVPAERLNIQDSVLYFSCDGKYRSKIGLPPSIAKGVAGSIDFEKIVLSLILFEVDKEGMYVNSKWEIQESPYTGDVVNSYNDGPLADGTQMGPFYELESSSPARELKAGEKMSYKQITCHFEGSIEDLNLIAKKVLGVNLNEIH